MLLDDLIESLGVVVGGIVLVLVVLVVFGVVGLVYRW